MGNKFGIEINHHSAHEISVSTPNIVWPWPVNWNRQRTETNRREWPGLSFLVTILVCVAGIWLQEPVGANMARGSCHLETAIIY